jgi:hypothetical protein
LAIPAFARPARSSTCGVSNGLACSKSQGRLPVVWLYSPQQVQLGGPARRQAARRPRAGRGNRRGRSPAALAAAQPPQALVLPARRAAVPVPWAVHLRRTVAVAGLLAQLSAEDRAALLAEMAPAPAKGKGKK